MLVLTGTTGSASRARLVAEGAAPFAGSRRDSAADSSASVPTVVSAIEMRVIGAVGRQGRLAG